MFAKNCPDASWLDPVTGVKCYGNADSFKQVLPNRPVKERIAIMRTVRWSMFAPAREE